MYRTQMDYKAIVREGYNTIATEYLAARKQPQQQDVELLDELVQRLPENAYVLDAGCGAGVPVTQTLSRRFRVVGVDFSEEQVCLARKLVPEAEYICRDFTALDFPEASFDAVCSYYAIIHVPRDEHRSLLKDFHRMLKPSGLALLSMGMSNISADIDEDFLSARMYWSHYDAETNFRLVEECGFGIIWSKFITESPAFGGGRHLFILAEKT